MCPGFFYARKRMDIVYFVKDSDENEELIYSLRSVEKNLKNVGKVWTIGGTPKGVKPDEHIDFEQTSNKHNNVMRMREAVLRNDDIPDEFILFNDDFFVMKKVSKVKNYCGGTLERRVKALADKNGTVTQYAMRLRRTAEELKRSGLDTLCYELHIPMVINREKALVVADSFNDQLAFRSLYGNRWFIGGEIRADVKVTDEKEEPDTKSDYLSTMDKTFANGKVGEYIREEFPDKCRWET
jgi:hypothetical protein